MNPKPQKPSERFVEAMKKIVSVPKAELQRREIAYQQARKHKNRKRHR